MTNPKVFQLLRAEPLDRCECGHVAVQHGKHSSFCGECGCAVYYPAKVEAYEPPAPPEFDPFL